MLSLWDGFKMYELDFYYMYEQNEYNDSRLEIDKFNIKELNEFFYYLDYEVEICSMNYDKYSDIFHGLIKLGILIQNRITVLEYLEEMR